MNTEHHSDAHSTHRRPAFMKAPLSTPALIIHSPPLAEKSIADLKPIGNAYDGTPIIVVPKDYQQTVAASFQAGMYGLDTESDCQNNQLRILQVYTGQVVYIFDVSVFDLLTDNFFTKFLRSKDRIKVGVDLDTDIFRIQQFYRNHKETNPSWRRYKEKFAINGCIDIQSIAHSLGEKYMGLEKLGAKYVEGFTSNPSNLGHYNPPTTEQYIYAANDAVVSLKIYRPLLMGAVILKLPTQTVVHVPETPLAIELDVDGVFDAYTEIFTEDEPVSIRSFLSTIVETYEPWKDFPMKKKQALAMKAIGEMARRGYFTHFDFEKDILWLSNKVWPPVVEEVKVPDKIVECVIEELPINPPKPKTRKRNKKKSKSTFNKSKTRSLDYIDAMVAEIDAATPKRSPPPTKASIPPMTVSMMNNETKSIYRLNVDPKASAADVAQIVIDQLKLLDNVIGALNTGSLKRRQTMSESFVQSFVDADGKINETFVQSLFASDKTVTPDLIQESMSEMSKIECEMTDEVYKSIQDELLANMTSTKTLGASLPYRDFIMIIAEIIGLVLPKYALGSKKVLMANIFVHMGLENHHLLSNVNGDLRLPVG